MALEQIDDMVEKETIYKVCIGGKRKWKIAATRILLVGDKTMVKIIPFDQSFLRLTIEGCVGDREIHNVSCTLANLEGFKRIVQLRNEAQAQADSQSTQDSPGEPSQFEKGIMKLFGTAAVVPAQRTKKLKVSHEQQREQRRDPSLLRIELPAFGQHAEPLVFDAIRHVNATDDIAVELKGQVIDRIVGFIRHLGIDAESLKRRRAYKQSGVTGLHSAGPRRGFKRKTAEGWVFPEARRPKNRRRRCDDDDSDNVDNDDESRQSDNADEHVACEHSPE